MTLRTEQFSLNLCKLVHSLIIVNKIVRKALKCMKHYILKPKTFLLLQPSALACIYRIFVGLIKFAQIKSFVLP